MYTKNKRTVATNINFRRLLYDEMLDYIRIKFGTYIKEAFGDKVIWKIKRYNSDKGYKGRIKVTFPNRQPNIEVAEEIIKNIFELSQRDLMVKCIAVSCKSLHDSIVNQASLYRENNKKNIQQIINQIKQKNENKSIRKNTRLYARNI